MPTFNYGNWWDQFFSPPSPAADEVISALDLANRGPAGQMPGSPTRVPVGAPTVTQFGAAPAPRPTSPFPTTPPLPPVVPPITPKPSVPGMLSAPPGATPAGVGTGVDPLAGIGSDVLAGGVGGNAQGAPRNTPGPNLAAGLGLLARAVSRPQQPATKMDFIKPSAPTSKPIQGGLNDPILWALFGKPI